MHLIKIFCVTSAFGNLDVGRAGSRGRDFFEATAESFMEQFVTEPTHSSGNTLDLILCNRDDLVKDVKLESRIGKSDHDLIAFKLCSNAKRGKNQLPTCNLGKGNYAVMRTAVKGIDWGEELGDKTINENWNSIRGCIRDLMSEHIPLKKNRKKNDPPWMNGEIRQSITEKKSAWKKWKETGKWKDEAEYKKK